MSAIIRLVSMQGYVFRLFFESLKEILSDVNLVFTKDSMTVLTVDNVRVALVHAYIDASKLDKYHCARDSFITGINLEHVFKMLKMITHNDTIEINIYEETPSFIDFVVHNSEKNCTTSFKVRMLDLVHPDIKLNDKEHDSVFILPSTAFQKICRDMMIISDVVKIEYENDHVSFSSTSDVASRKDTFRPHEQGLVFTKQSRNKFSQLFNIKYLNLFSKATNLCSVSIIHLRDREPMTIKYAVSNIGFISYTLAPIFAE